MQEPRREPVRPPESTAPPGDGPEVAVGQQGSEGKPEVREARGHRAWESELEPAPWEKLEELNTHTQNHGPPHAQHRGSLRPGELPRGHPV